MAVDPEKIERQLATMVEGLRPFTEGAEPNNVLARLQSTVVPAFVRWKAGEMNRGADENSVLNAFVCFVSSQMVSVVCEVVRSNQPGNEHFRLANSLLQAIGEEIGAIMTGERAMDAYNVPTERPN